jgi:hypothetical protein
MQPLMLASSALSAYGQIRAGQAQREMYDEQAAQARMRGRSEAIAYKQQGADVLRRREVLIQQADLRQSCSNMQWPRVFERRILQRIMRS